MLWGGGALHPPFFRIVSVMSAPFKDKSYKPTTLKFQVNFQFNHPLVTVTLPPRTASVVDDLQKYVKLPQNIGHCKKTIANFKKLSGYISIGYLYLELIQVFILNKTRVCTKV